MKTEYIKPIIKVEKLCLEEGMLAGSGQTGEQDDKPAKGSIGFMDDEDEGPISAKSPFGY